MSLFQALAYFLGEAVRNILRGWRISLLAMATTALSLFIGGTLILVGANLASAVDSWRADAQLVIYLDEGISDEALASLRALLASSPSVSSTRAVSSEEAYERFQRRFPDLEDVADDLERSPLPDSIEVTTTGVRNQIATLAAGISRQPGVEEVDDDGEWLESLDTAASVARLLGLLVGGILMVAAAVSIASVVRLSTFVYRREIAAMRLLGATEFFVRGPFVVEGLLQGLMGALLALGALWLGYQGFGALDLPWFVRGALLDLFLDRMQVVGLLAFGGVAGLAGGLIPLRERSGVFG